MEERVLIASILYSISLLPPHIEMKNNIFSIIEQQESTDKPFSNDMRDLHEKLARLKSKHELVRNQIAAIRMQSKQQIFYNI
jgi:hypothetical protein